MRDAGAGGREVDVVSRSIARGCAFSNTAVTAHFNFVVITAHNIIPYSVSQAVD